MVNKQDSYQLLKANEGGPFKESISKAGNWMQYILHKVEPGEVHLRLKVLPDMCNPLDALHGGIYALIMDEAVGLAVYTVCEGAFYTTLDLNVAHLFSAPLGEELTAIGKVIRFGKKIAYTEGSIYNAENKLICRATSNLVNTGKRIFDFYAEQ
jgi:acyl-coenzyme A thioesterase 13